MNAQTIASRILIQEPRRCTEAELVDFRGLVKQGGQVTPVGLASRIQNALLLAFHYSGSALAGICALKRPAKLYKRRLFQDAGLPGGWSAVEIELGWAVTHPDFRGHGVCSGLMDQLLRCVPDTAVFATAATDNVAMRHLLSRFHFRKVGKSIDADAGQQRSKALWIRPAAA